MNGKEKCRILKQIRAEIAAQNDIDLVIEECTHKGDCRGTCPRCEAEVRYLEQELEKRRKLKKTVALAGVSAGVTLALSGCAAVDRLADIALAPLRGAGVRPTPTPEIMELTGEVPSEPQLQGVIPPLDWNGDDPKPEPGPEPEPAGPDEIDPELVQGEVGIEYRPEEWDEWSV